MSGFWPDAIGGGPRAATGKRGVNVPAVAASAVASSFLPEVHEGTVQPLAESVLSKKVCGSSSSHFHQHGGSSFLHVSIEGMPAFHKDPRSDGDDTWGGGLPPGGAPPPGGFGNGNDSECLTCACELAKVDGPEKESALVIPNVQHHDWYQHSKGGRARESFMLTLFVTGAGLGAVGAKRAKDYKDRQDKIAAKEAAATEGLEEEEDTEVAASGGAGAGSGSGSGSAGGGSRGSRRGSQQPRGSRASQGSI